MNIRGSAWQGGILAKMKGRFLGLKYAIDLISGRELTHTKMDMGIAFILRFPFYVRKNRDQVRKWAVIALNQAKEAEPYVPHQVALANVRLAEIGFYFPQNYGEIGFRADHAYALRDAIIAEGAYGKQQLASILRHLGEIRMRMKYYEKAEALLHEAMGFAALTGATDQLYKTSLVLYELMQRMQSRETR